MDPDHHSAHNVYLLRSAHTRRTYVGYSPDPFRRLRQHNGEIAGGSAPTAGRPWELVLFVRGFRSKHSALAFEYAWQKPHSSRHTARMWGVLGMSECSVRTSVSVRRRALSMLLGHGVLGHEPLSVCEVA